jgi:hypothetical protein
MYGWIFLIFILTVFLYWYFIHSRESFHPHHRAHLIELPKFVCSLTTSPTRIHLLRPVIDALLHQTYPCDYILLNLPMVFSRTGETYEIPDELKNNPKIKINRMKEDLGPICKIKGAIDFIPSDENVFIVYLDDDISYPLPMLEYYREYIELYGKDTVYAPSGFTYKDGIVYEWGTYEYIKVPEGYGSVCVHRSLIGEDFDSYVKQMVANKDCRLSDDMVMGYYFELKDIPIRQVFRPDFNDKYILKHSVLEYGDKEDALHNGASGMVREQGHAMKYTRCRRFMETY